MRYAAIAAGIVVLILYGSLYPFQFHSRSGPTGPLDHLLSTCRHPMDRGDLISNVLLYLPLGIFAGRALRGKSVGAAVLVATVLGVALSAGIEVAQYYDRTRSSDLCDVYANGAGALLGALAANFLHHDRFPGIYWRPFAILLLCTWIGDGLFPYLPPFEISRYTALHHAFQSSRFAPMDLYAQTAFWLAAAMLIEALFGVIRSRFLLPLLIAGILLARLANAVISPADIAGGAIAVVAWIALSRISNRAPAVATLFLIFAILQPLQPFTFLSQPHSFRWIPFLSFIEGPRYNGTRVFLEKSFTYGALVWLWVQAGFSWTLTTISAVALEFSLRLAQVYLPGRSAEITDAIMVLILAVVMNLMNDSRSTRKLD
jgi:VanZ family protein